MAATHGSCPTVLLYLVPVLFLDFLVIAMPRSIMPQLLDARYGAKAYIYLGVAETVRGLLTFVCAPLLGALSDVAGRKWFFISCIVGTALPSLILAVTPRLEVYLCTLASSGCLASTFPLAFAHIADNVPPARRAQAFGVATGIGLGGAFCIGPMLGAAIERWSGRAQTVFDLCLWITVANALIAIVFIRDAQPWPREQPLSPTTRARRRRELLRRANPIGALNLVRGNPALRLLALITFFYYLALVSHVATQSPELASLPAAHLAFEPSHAQWGFIANSLLYVRRRFALGSPAAAALLSIFGLTSLVSQSVGLRLATRVLSEPQITRLCFACSLSSLCLFGVASEVRPLYLAMVLLGVSVGGFACVFLINNVGVVALRDRFGIRPLCFGKKRSASTIASDTNVAAASPFLRLIQTPTVPLRT